MHKASYALYSQLGPTSSMRSGMPMLGGDRVLSGVPTYMWLTPETSQNSLMDNSETLEALPSTDGEVLPEMLTREAVT